MCLHRWVFPGNDFSLMLLRDCYVGHGKEAPEIEDLPRLEFLNLKNRPEELKLFPVDEAMALYIERCARSGSVPWPVRRFIQRGQGTITEVGSFVSQPVPVKKACAFVRKAQQRSRK